MSRINRGKGEAWLRGGQTFSHNIDMVMEVLGRLLILCLVWGMVCVWQGNSSASDLEQEYGLQTAQAAIFEWAGNGFLPDKVSIKGLDGVERTYRNADVPKLTWLQPYARSYWHKLRKALLMWVLGDFAVLAIATAWFVHYGEEKLKARQIRGQKVVEIGDLMTQIYTFNEEMKVQRNNPGHQPAKVVGVPFPYETEFEHFFTAGSPGAGKSQAIHTIIESVRARGDRAIIYDPELEFIKHHYRPDRDLILNPYDARSIRWSPFNDATDRNELETLAKCLWKAPNNGDPYWTDAARQTFVWATYQFKTLFPDATLQDLLQMFFGPHELLAWLLRGTPAAMHVEGGGNRVTSIKSVMTTGLNSLTHLVGEQSTFSIREWVNSPTGEGGFLFLSAPETHIESLRPLIGFWFELVISSLLSRRDDYRPATFVVIDEFYSLGRIESLATGPVRLRKYNGAMVLGMQQFSQLQEVYGHETATTIIGQCATKLILRCQDPDTAKFMSDQLGRAQVRRVDESVSFGANSQRDGVNLNAKEEIEPVALPEDLMNQPKLQGFLKVSSARLGEAFPAATLRFDHRKRTRIAEDIVPLTGPSPTEIFMRELQRSHEQMREERPVDTAGVGTPPIGAADRAAAGRVRFDPITGEVLDDDLEVGSADGGTAEPADRAEATAAANEDGGPRIRPPDERAGPGEGGQLDPIAANNVVLPELAAAGNLDRTSRLAVDAYRSRLDQQAKQTAFMQLIDRVRRDMEQGIPLNGLAVWKGRPGPDQAREEKPALWPFSRGQSREDLGDDDGLNEPAGIGGPLS